MGTDIKLDEIINGYLDAWELPDSQYRRISALAIRGYRQIYMHCTAQPQEIELEVLGNKTAILPCDCLNKIRVGVLNGMGEISSLTENDLLSFGDVGSASRTTQISEPILVRNDGNIYYDPNGNYLTPFIFGQFGSGAKSDLGFYAIDWKSRLIVFDFNFSYSSIWLKYLPVFNDDGEYPVNPFFIESLLAFIEWNDKRRTLNDRNLAQVRYYNEMRIGRRSMKPFDPTQTFNQYYRTTRQARW